MGTILTIITVPAAVGAASSGVSASTILGENRTFNLRGLQAGDTIDIQGANDDVDADYGSILRVSYSGTQASTTTFPSESSQWYRAKRIAKGINNPGIGRTLRISGDAVSGAVSGQYGNGSDGVVVVANGDTLTLSQPLYATTLLVEAGGIFEPRGLDVFATDSIINQGTIRNKGGDGLSDGTAGDGGYSSGVIPYGTAGNGGAGQSASGAAAPSVRWILGGSGAAGGNGSAEGAAGGAGATATGTMPNDLVTAIQLLNVYTVPLNLGVFGPPTLPDIVGGGGGGGGGGAGFGLDPSGAGGGGGGGIGCFASPSITNEGSVDYSGGNGGDGGAVTEGVGKGGGGGGGGGTLRFVCEAFTNTGTVSVAGGLGGVGSGTGTAGSDGAAGNWAAIP